LNGLIRNNNNELKDNQIKYQRLESTISEYKNIEMKMKDLENKIGMLSQENSRLNGLIRDKN
jgi:cell shape-determining protein MreC